MSIGILGVVKAFAFRVCLKSLEISATVGILALSQDPALIGAVYGELEQRLRDAYHNYYSSTDGGSAGPSGSTGGGSNYGDMDPRQFRKLVESYQNIAEQCRKQGQEPLTASKAQELYDELIRRGWYHYRGVEHEWVGGQHINMYGPNGEVLHFPVPPGFQPNLPLGVGG